MKSILLTRDVILGNLDNSHDCIYFSSNEDLNDLFLGIDFSDKKVLSVLGSGDQIFSLYNRDAKEVESFDINSLAFYYFYLRKWSILYYDEYYPNVFSNDEINKIIKCVRPSDENELDALKYWENYLTHFSSYFTNYLFFRNSGPDKNRIKDLKKLKEKLVSKDFKFHNIDLSKDRVDSKFDYAIISNILEYYPNDCKAMQTIVSNLYDMLSDNGKVIVSYLMNLSCTSNEMYTFKPFFTPWNLFDKNGNNIGCVYTKR